ncbi:NYN domain-containing protein [Pirellulales bacterium]|nr:NYN domain-containing protein [Pirellulales bacterium]
MSLLIDGYNLLYVSGIGAPGAGDKSFQRSREKLIRFLANAIEPAELARTTVVFDAADAPPGLPRTYDYDGMTVLFAAEYPDADALIEELIAADHAPRSLLVVSSDHRLQRAARRRRARIIDSEVWYAEACRQLRVRRTSTDPPPAKPTGKVSPAEVNYWVEKFADDELPDLTDADADADESNERIDNPFPPGYGEDIGGV